MGIIKNSKAANRLLIERALNVVVLRRVEKARKAAEKVTTSKVAVKRAVGVPAAGIVIREPAEALVIEAAIQAPIAGVEQPFEGVIKEPAQAADEIIKEVLKDLAGDGAEEER